MQIMTPTWWSGLILDPLWGQTLSHLQQPCAVRVSLLQPSTASYFGWCIMTNLVISMMLYRFVQKYRVPLNPPVYHRFP